MGDDGSEEGRRRGGHGGRGSWAGEWGLSAERGRMDE